MTRTLYRSRTDRMIFGVCGGLGEYFEIDPTVVRLLAVLAAWLTGGVVILVYIVMGIVVPEEPLEGAADRTVTPAAPYAPPRTAAVERRDVAMTDDNVGDTTPRPEEGAGPAEQAPTAELPLAEAPTAQMPPAEAPTAEMPPAEGPTAEMPPAPASYTPPTGQTPPAGYGQPQAPRPSDEWERGRDHDRRGGLIGGLVLIVIGGLFLIQQFVPGVDIGRFWPVILIVIGLAIIFRRR